MTTIGLQYLFKKRSLGTHGMWLELCEKCSDEVYGSVLSSRPFVASGICVLNCGFYVRVGHKHIKLDCCSKINKLCGVRVT